MSKLDDAKTELDALENEKLVETQKKIDALKQEKATKVNQEGKEREYIATRDRMAKELNLALPNPIQPSGDQTKEKKNKLQGFNDTFLKNHKYTPVEYGSQKWQMGYEFDSDAGCDNDVSDWTPAEVFSNLIWSAFYCKGYLAGRVTVRGVDFTRGKGDTVSIRVRGKRTAQGPLTPCECLSCVSSSFTKVHLHLDSYGDLAEICELDLQLAGDEVKDGIIEDMASALAEQVDLEIYNQLATSGAAHVHLNWCCSGPSLDDCCFQAIDIYNQIVTLEADMRTNGYHPDYIIMGPALAAYFKYRQMLSQQGFQISFNGNELSKIGSMSLIEFPCATACSTVTDTVVAIILDSSRAVGEGWGMAPKLEQDRDIDCDSTTVAIHMYVGIDELDVNAIRLIRTPVNC